MKKIAQGNTAEIYEYTKDTICKLFWNDYPKQAIELEYKNAGILYEVTHLSPKCHEQVCIDGRAGIIYDKLVGHDLLKEMIEDLSDKNKILSILDEMVELQKNLLTYEGKECISYKSFLWSLVPERSEEYTYMIKLIDELHDGDCICHGDFHPGNVWRNNDGSLSIIDCMNVCKGPREYDIARTFFLMTEEQEKDETIRELKKMIGTAYLAKMGYDSEGISEYLKVITLCRKYEMAGED